MNTESHLCQLHNTSTLKNVFPLSSCRYICLLCDKKKISGYTNPDHVSNPFGYCYLAPTICIDCSINYKHCMWCTPTCDQ